MFPTWQLAFVILGFVLSRARSWTSMTLVDLFQIRIFCDLLKQTQGKKMKKKKKRNRTVVYTVTNYTLKKNFLGVRPYFYIPFG